MNKTAPQISNCSIDIRGDNKFLDFIKFQETKSFSKIKKRLEAEIKVQTNEVVLKQVDYLGIEHKSDNNEYMSIKTSQFLRYLIGQNLSVLINSEFGKKRSTEFQETYFNDSEQLKNHLI